MVMACTIFQHLEYQEIDIQLHQVKNITLGQIESEQPIVRVNDIMHNDLLEQI
jgi:hypothetical protein